MTDATIRMQGRFHLIRRVTTARSGRDVVQFIIFKHGASALEEVKRFRGELTKDRAISEFDQLVLNAQLSD